MDNGIGVVDGSHVGENNGADDLILESKVEQTAVSVSDGGMDSGSKEDEVFEDATDAVIPRVDYKSVLLNEEAHADKKYNLGDSLELRCNLDDECEIEKFEEAICVSSEAQNVVEEPVVVVHEKVEGLVGGEPFNEIALEEKIDEQSAPEKVTGAEMNVFKNDGLVDNGKVDTSRESDLNAVEEIEILEDDGEVNEKSSVLVELEKSNDELSDDVNLDPATVYDNLHDANVNKQESQPLEKLETRYANGVDGGDTDSQQEIESNGEILHEVDKNVELNETFGIFDSYHQAIKNGEVESASDCQADTVVESIDTLNNPDTILKDDNTVELRTEVLASLDHVHQDKKGEEQRDTSANLALKGQDDDRCVKLKDTTTPIEPNHQEEGCQLKDNLHTSREENAVTLAVEGSPSSKDYTVEKDDKIQASSSDMGTENSKGAQPHCVDASVEASNGLAEMPGKKGTEDEEVTQRTKGFIEQEIKSAVSDVTSPTEKTKGNIEQEIKSAVSDVTSPAEKIKGNIEQEIKSAASDVSSSAEKYSTPSPTAAAPAPTRPAGLGRAAPLLEPAPRVAQQPRVNGTVPQIQSQLIEDPTNGEAEENDDTREKLQMIRVKFLRLAHRLGQTPHNVVVAQVLYRLGLAEQLRGRNGSRVAAFSFDRASAMAEQLEAAGQEPLDFSCTIMVLGKTGVGKSATINSIFDENKFSTDAFQFGTMKVQDVVGTVQGIKVRVIDTPGLLPSSSDQRRNEKTLHSVKRFIQRSPPDIVLYLDRLDMQSRDFGDMPLLRTITDIFGPSIWFNAIVVLTHAASAPPEGPNGTATSYDMFVTQRSHVVQQAIRQAAGDMRLMNPVSLVENHSACRTNRAGQRVLPNGQVWKPHLLLLSFASKILAEANTLLKLQDSPPGKPFASRVRAPPLPFLLSTLLQSRPQLKLPQEQFGDDDDTLDDDLDDSSESDDESEYDELPPFKRLTKAQLAKLTKGQKKAYNDELEYREKLFMKKQLKEEKRRRKLMKKMAASAKDLPSEYTENAEEESGGAASVPVPLPDLALPASFDSDNPTHRYRSLDSFANQWLMRPVLDSHGWDHDVGYEGINVERLFVVKDKIPVSFSGQATKDKKDANLQMEVTSSVKHGEGKGTTLGFDMQTLGKDIAYTLRSETRFSNYRRNKATAGLSVTHIGDALTAGVKVEDKLVVSKRSRLVVSGGAIVGRGDIAYGGSLEATLRDKDHPLGRFLSTVGLSVMDWHGDLALGWNAQTQIPIGRYTNLIGRVNLNNRGSGQVSIRLNSSEQLQIALVVLVPLLNKLLGYSQPVQFGQ